MSESIYNCIYTLEVLWMKINDNSHPLSLHIPPHAQFSLLVTNWVITSSNICHQEPSFDPHTPSVQYEFCLQWKNHANLHIFDAKNYDKLCKQMKVLFGYQNVLEVIKNGVNPLDQGTTDARRATHKEERKKDFKTLFFIHQYVDGDNFEKVSDCESSKQAWKIL